MRVMTSGNPIFGATAMAMATTVRMGIQIAVLPIVGRMLGPQAYGQVALVTPFVFFAMLLATAGLGNYIVQAATVTTEVEGTVFCFSGAISLVTALLFTALAYPLGHLLGEPQFPPLLVAMSAILLLASFTIVPGALLLRARKYEWLSLSELASSVLSLAVVIGCIVAGLGVWSLVVQQLALWLTKAAILTAGSRARPQFVFRQQALREALSFTGRITGSAIVMFIAGNLDNVLIGALLGAKALGFYALAFQIVGLPQIALSGSVYGAMLSSVSEAHRGGASTPALFVRTLRGTMLAAAPAITGLAVTSVLSVPLILGAQWIPMVKLILLLAPYGLVQLFWVPIYAYLAGSGRVHVSFGLTLINASLVVAGILAGVAMGGSAAVAAAVTLASILALAVWLRAVAAESGLTYDAIGKVLAAPLISSAVMGACVLALACLMPESILLAVRFLIAVVSGIAIYGFMLFVFFHEELAADLAEVRAAVPARFARRL